MGSLNKVILLGRLGADPEIKYTSEGKCIAKFSLATSKSRKIKSNENEKFQQTEWSKVICFGRLAEICRDSLRKGWKVCVEGELNTTKWIDNNNVNHYITSIVAFNVQFVCKSDKFKDEEKFEITENKEDSFNQDDTPF